MSLRVSFIASLDPDIPYSLLAYHPEFKMVDLPPTSRALADVCRESAFKAGVKRVRVGNEQILK